jgi:halimadienyl-diphosphate synthase
MEPPVLGRGWSQADDTCVAGLDRPRRLTLLDQELLALVVAIGKDGGMASPSVYNTAQVLRLYPPTESGETLAWLIGQQKGDGSWGDSTAPFAADVATLAALLALQRAQHHAAARAALKRGAAYLRALAPLPRLRQEALPVAAELILPTLLSQARQAGLELDQGRYLPLIALSKRYLRKIAGRQLPAGSPPLHSWEAWGVQPEASHLDSAGSIGHSPAATAAWLAAAGADPRMRPLRSRAGAYLRAAAAHTEVRIPGVVPTVWPIPRFEQAFVLYVLLVAGLLDRPELRASVRQQLVMLAAALTPRGLGLGDGFMADGDDTAAALAVLSAAGRPVDRGLLWRFYHKDQFVSFPGELQPAISVTTRAVHALALMGERCEPAERSILAQQQPDGRWLADKWNISWLYTTSHAIIALAATGRHRPLRVAYQAVLNAQTPGGGWGSGTAPTAEETAYAILALHSLGRVGLLDQDGWLALRRAARWLKTHPGRPDQCLWLDKETYRPHRIARAFELSALLCANTLLGTA